MARSIAALLSMYNDISLLQLDMFDSLFKLVIQAISRPTSDIALYSASAEDNETVVWRWDFHEIMWFPARIT